MRPRKMDPVQYPLLDGVSISLVKHHSCEVTFSEPGFLTVYCCCATTVHESHVFIRLGLASSEKQNPQVIVNIEN